MTTLRRIHKNTELPSDKWDPYFDVYERHLEKFRHCSYYLIEVGVQGGGSLEMWETYLGSSRASKITGIDIDPDVKIRLGDKFDIVIGDQGDPLFWDHFISNNMKQNEIDIVIDDGGHHPHQQIVTFEKLFPLVSEIGVYICEDIHTAYWPDYSGGLKRPGTFMEYAKTLSDLLNKEHIPEAYVKANFNDSTLNLIKDLNSIHFYDSMVVFEKGCKPFTRVFGGKQNNA